jgi:hypothetical protein
MAINDFDDNLVDDNNNNNDDYIYDLYGNNENKKKCNGSHFI